MSNITPAQALKHPTWNMGNMVTINSSTLVNKGLELMEASFLFGTDNIEVVVHPQSVVHSMVQFVDGSTLAQLSTPDMRLPIAVALAYPERLPNISKKIDWLNAFSLDFMPLDNEAFPAVEIARNALTSSNLHPAVYNACNEVLVERFLNCNIQYLDLVDSLGSIVNRFDSVYRGFKDIDLHDINEAESWARRIAQELRY
jgi:1-deoxy-D-xylulose-5-phosphate reductoisomerase